MELATSSAITELKAGQPYWASEWTAIGGEMVRWYVVPVKPGSRRSPIISYACKGVDSNGQVYFHANSRDYSSEDHMELGLLESFL